MNDAKHPHWQHIRVKEIPKKVYCVFLKSENNRNRCCLLAGCVSFEVEGWTLERLTIYYVPWYAIAVDIVIATRRRYSVLCRCIDYLTISINLSYTTHLLPLPTLNYGTTFTPVRF